MPNTLTIGHRKIKLAMVEKLYPLCWLPFYNWTFICIIILCLLSLQNEAILYSSPLLCDFPTLELWRMSYHRPCKKLYLTSKLGEGSSILPTNHSAEMQTITDYVDFFVDRLFLFCNFYCFSVPSVSFKHIKFILNSWSVNHEILSVYIQYLHLEDLPIIPSEERTGIMGTCCSCWSHDGIGGEVSFKLEDRSMKTLIEVYYLLYYTSDGNYDVGNDNECKSLL